MGLTNKSHGRGSTPSSSEISTKYTVAIAGNPNVGKSTVFNALTGMNQHTGNWPGKTVGYAEGECMIGGMRCLAVDIPGTYSLHTHSPEEEVAREVLTGDLDLTLIVCDAACLERNLVLALQILELKKPSVLCINLLDEAQKRGIRVDTKLLSARLGIPVVGTVAREKRGLDELLRTMAQALCTEQRQGCEAPSEESKAANLHGEDAQRYISLAEEICHGAVTYDTEDYDRGDRLLDRLFTGKKTSYPIMIALLLFILWLTVTGANYPSELLSSLLLGFGDRLGIWLLELGFPAVLKGLLIDGAYRTTAWIVSVMLPPMAIFFPLFTVLEDFGYLPRVAYNLDNPFRKCGSCGKQALTMCMGFGCNAAGVVGCRIIDSPRERLISMLTNALVPCNGRFPLLISLLTMFFISGGGGLGSTFTSAVLLTLLILFSVLATLLLSKLLSKTLLRGLPSAFTLELPPYRTPQIGRVIIRSVMDRTVFVLGRALITAIPAGLLIWVMANISVGDSSLLLLCARFLDPFAQILGLDGIILLAFLLGTPANEIVIPIVIMGYASTTSLTSEVGIEYVRTLFLTNGWTACTALCVILFSLFHWPCATTLLTIKKESGSIKWMLVAALLPTLLGILLCTTVNLLLKGLG